MTRTDLRSFDNRDYRPGNKVRIALWYITNVLFFQSALPWPGALKVALLRAFGARVGKGLRIKPSVNIKYPWFLEIGDFVWIGEGVWIDNLTRVRLGNDVCLSQGAMLLTGNHDYSKSSFDLITGEIKLEDGVWIGAKSVVCPGVTCASHAVLSVGSIATRNLDPYTIYSGNPAEPKRARSIS
jgi:putative colanic acid biosynthesis acetyltransferase WcaF